MSKHIFREYDIRGVAERDLTDDIAERIGRGVAELIGRSLGRAPRLAVGRDCRLSGPRIHAALTRGMQRGGAQLLDVGVGPTPALYFGVHHLNTDGGVMITGSHNAAPDNGFKI
ncbi:MAG: Phosphomannomutase, partial [Polyangiaceae bacterium]|nr:Phosphomannomutase [Polyangiaceae bacterium]